MESKGARSRREAALLTLFFLAFSCAPAPTGPGTIRVTVTGVASSVGSGGTVTATSGTTSLMLDLPGTLPSTGQSSGEIGGVPPGAYEVRYVPPKGHHLLAASLNPMNVTVAPGATVSVNFAAQPSPQPTLVFASDWHTGIGNTGIAVRDGTKWGAATAFDMDRVTVVKADGLDFPAGMQNVLAVRYSDSDPTAASIAKQDGWALPAVGQSIWFRLYFRYTLDGTAGTGFHPVQPCWQADMCCAQSWWSMARGDSGHVTWSIALETGDPITQHEWGTSLERDITYRIEERWERTGTTTWKLHLAVFDANDSLIRDDTSFGCLFHGAGTHVLSDGLTLVTADPACMQSKLLGNPGLMPGSGSDNLAANRVYYGGFAVSLEDWIGPYVPGEGT